MIGAGRLPTPTPYPSPQGGGGSAGVGALTTFRAVAGATSAPPSPLWGVIQGGGLRREAIP